MNGFLYRNRIYTDAEIQALTNELAEVDLSLPADKTTSRASKCSDKDSSHARHTRPTR